MLAASVAALIADTLLLSSELAEILFSIISFTIIFVVLSGVFYLAGNIVVGRNRVSLKDAIAISVPEPSFSLYASLFLA